MRNAMMFESGLADWIVAPKLIRANRRAFFYILDYVRHQSFRLNIFSNLGSHASASLQNSNNGNFIFRPAPTFSFVLSTDIGFVGFTNAFKDSAIALHKLSDLVSHTPSCL